jgi:Ca-activated chloride channel family protein
MFKTPVLLFSLFLALGLVLSSFISPKTSISGNQARDSSFPLTIIKARGFKGTPVTTQNQNFRFITGLENDHYFQDSSNRFVNFYLETRLTNTRTQRVRVPLNIAIVLDRSGSMNGVKMGYAKKAAKEIISRLFPEDFVSLVIYDNTVDSLQPPVQVVNKEKIYAQVDRIFPRGSTNLWGGTEMGYAFVQRNYKSGYINRVLLISDGLANTGLTDSLIIHQKVEGFKENGISLSTFGVGLDYNETLMTDMAETGEGNYYFIDAPQKMAAIFSRELEGLMNIAGREAEVRIRMPQGVSLESGYPLEYSVKGDEVFIKLRDIYLHDTKAALLRFRLDRNINGPLHFNSTLQYKEAGMDQTRTATHDNVLTPIRSREEFLTHYNRKVLEQTVLFTVNERMERAMMEVDRGNQKKAEGLVRENSTYLKAHSYLFSESVELQKMDSTVSQYITRLAVAKSQNADSLKRLQKTHRAINYQIRNKKGSGQW